VRRAALALALLALAPACRRRGHARRARDPRQEFATGCVDARYVSAPAVPAPALGAEAPRVVTTARLAGKRYVAWATDEGAVLWREGAVNSTRVTPPIPGAAFAMDATATRLLLLWVSRDREALLAAFDDGLAARAFPPWGRGVTEVALAATSDGALAVWRDPRGIVARPIGPRGEPGGAAEVIATGAVDAPTVAWTGGSWAVVWRAVEGGAGFVRMRTIGRDGVPRGPAVDVVRTDAAIGPPSACWGAGRLAVTWSDARNGDRGLQSAAVDRAGRPAAEPQRLSVRFAEGARASLAWDGAAFGVAWWEPVGGGAPRSYFALLDRTGRRIGTGMRVLADDDAAALTLPALAWERPQYVLAVVRAGREVELRRTGPRGCDLPPYVAPAR